MLKLIGFCICISLGGFMLLGMVSAVELFDCETRHSECTILIIPKDDLVDWQDMPDTTEKTNETTRS